MKPRNQDVRKRKPTDGPTLRPGRAPRALLSVRSAFVLTVAAFAALGGAALLYAAHRPVALVVLGAVGIFAGALKLLDSLIELGTPGPLWGASNNGATNPPLAVQFTEHRQQGRDHA